MPKSKTAPAATAQVTAPPAPVEELTLTRDEVYRIVNATYHAFVELGKNPTFAIRNRAWAYRDVGTKIDGLYSRLIEHRGHDVFQVKFFLKEKASKEEKDDATGEDV